MRTEIKNKLTKISLIALTAGSLASCASGPNTRWCAFDDRREPAYRNKCANMKYDYGQDGYIKPSRKNKSTYIPVNSLKDLRGYLMIPPGVDQENLRSCAKKFRETGAIDCGEFN